jgi:hypothetical protein
MLYRHGDVLIQQEQKLPEKARKLPHLILAHGEVTGHSHRIKTKSTAKLYETPDDLYLEVTADIAEVIHEEHATIELPQGYYRVWRQREYSPTEIRIIRD